ncbi:hypothetical protein ACFE04_006720 [Oxalis oulophora]
MSDILAKSLVSKRPKGGNQPYIDFSTNDVSIKPAHRFNTDSTHDTLDYKCDVAMNYPHPQTYVRPSHLKKSCDSPHYVLAMMGVVSHVLFPISHDGSRELSSYDQPCRES